MALIAAKEYFNLIPNKITFGYDNPSPLSTSTSTSTSTSASASASNDWKEKGRDQNFDRDNRSTASLTALSKEYRKARRKK